MIRSAGKSGRSLLCTIYADAANTGWQQNPEAYTIKKTVVDNSTRLLLKLGAGGGVAISIVPR